MAYMFCAKSVCFGKGERLYNKEQLVRRERVMERCCIS